MADDVVFNLIGDAASAVDAIDALVSAFEGLQSSLEALALGIETLNQFVAALSEISTAASELAVVGDDAVAAAEGLSALANESIAVADSLAAAGQEAAVVGSEMAAVGEEGTVSLEELVASLAVVGPSLASVSEDISLIPTALDQVAAASDVVASSWMALDAGAIGINAIFNDMADAGGAAMMGLAEDSVTLNAALASVGASASGAAAGMASVGSAAATAGAEVAGANEAMNGSQFMVLMLAGVLIQLSSSFLQMGMQAQDAIAHITGLADQSLATAAGAQRLSQVIDTLNADCIKFGITAANAANGLYYIISAGFSTSDALKILAVSMEAASATGTKMDTVSNALTSIMNAYGVSANRAKEVTNQMVQAVVSGKQTFQDFANAIGAVAQPAHSAGVGINEMLAAESTMTEVQPRVRQDTQNLAALFNYLAENQKKVTTAAKGIDPAFNANAFAAADLEGKLKMLNQAAAHNAKSSADVAANMKTLLGNMTNVKTATMVATDGYKMYEQKLRDINHSQHTLDVAFQQSEATLSAAMNHITAALSVMAEKFVTAISPTLVPIMNSIAGAMSQLASHTQILMAVLAALGVLIAGVLIGALIALGAMFLSIVGPALLIAAPIAALVGLFVAFLPQIQAFNNRFQITTAIMNAIHVAVAFVVNIFQQLVTWLYNAVGGAAGINGAFRFIQGAFNSIGQIVQTILLPALRDAWATIVSNVGPALQQLGHVLHALAPGFQAIAILIGAVLVGAFVAVIAAIAGIISGLSVFIRGLAFILSGVVLFVTGIIQLFVGLWEAVSGLFEGNSAKMIDGWNMMGQAIDNIVAGFLNAVLGVFMAIFGTLIAAVLGFIRAVISAFQNLSNTLVGHSIIPDMLNLMVQVFQQAFVRMVSAIAQGITQIISRAQNLASQLGNIFHNLAAQAFTWGADFMRMMASGVQNAAGAVISAAQGVASKVAALLHFSKPDVGPLADADKWMPDFGNLLASGLSAQAIKVQGAAINVANSITKSAPTPANIAQLSTPSLSNANNNATVALLAQILAELQRQTGKIGSTGSAKGTIGHAMPGTQLGTIKPQFNNGSAISDVYAQLDALSGIASLNGSRGAISGLGII